MIGALGVLGLTTLPVHFPHHIWIKKGKSLLAFDYQGMKPSCGSERGKLA